MELNAFILVPALLLIVALIVNYIIRSQNKKIYQQLKDEIYEKIGLSRRNNINYIDATITVKSRQALAKYDTISYFKESNVSIDEAERILHRKKDCAKYLNDFLKDNEYRSRRFYDKIESSIRTIISNEGAYRICVNYITSAGNLLDKKVLAVNQADINYYKANKMLFMDKKEALKYKQHEYYEKVSSINDYANNNKEALIIAGSQEKLDVLITKLLERTDNAIKKVKAVESDEWKQIGDFIRITDDDIKKLIEQNKKILDYYETNDFLQIKKTCENLINSQKEFNEYINEKIQTVSKLFGTRIVRNETTISDENNYIRPYKKTITPFTAEVSSTVFGSAENNPLEYVVKYFYPDKKQYNEQIQNLQLLTEELYTLKEAKQIIENYKNDYNQYIVNVPNYVMEYDSDGFYSRLGFANITEALFAVEYKFVYTSNGGMAQRSFAVSMTEDTIAELIKILESKMTASAFAKEQRTLMTKKLRDYIKNRDDFTCCNCGNSSLKEPNLLLEIDHIIPIAKGGITEESNLQTLCWKCNRSKSDKLI